MKEATGELSMTVVTIIAIAAIAAILGILTPLVKDFINKSWSNLSNTNITYVEVVEENVNI